MNDTGIEIGARDLWGYGLHATVDFTYKFKLTFY